MQHPLRERMRCPRFDQLLSVADELPSSWLVSTDERLSYTVRGGITRIVPQSNHADDFGTVEPLCQDPTRQPPAVVPGAGHGGSAFFAVTGSALPQRPARMGNCSNATLIRGGPMRATLPCEVSGSCLALR